MGLFGACAGHSGMGGTRLWPPACSQVSCILYHKGCVGILACISKLCPPPPRATPPGWGAVVSWFGGEEILHLWPQGHFREESQGPRHPKCGVRLGAWLLEHTFGEGCAWQRPRVGPCQAGTQGTVLCSGSSCESMLMGVRLGSAQGCCMTLGVVKN